MTNPNKTGTTHEAKPREGMLRKPERRDPKVDANPPAGERWNEPSGQSAAETRRGQGVARDPYPPVNPDRPLEGAQESRRFRDEQTSVPRPAGVGEEE